jgi:hypothetical protein
MAPPFSGKMIAITVSNSNAVPGDAEDSASYNDVKREILALGGKISSTVHKNVDFLIASDSAVEQCTQRVRKADKYDILVLKVEYVEHCRSNKKDTNTAPFEYSNISAVVKNYEKHAKAKAVGVPASEEEKKPASKKKKRTASEAFTIEHTMACECSCTCHDHGESSCHYCVNAHAVVPPTTEGNGDDHNSDGEKKKKKKSKKEKK